MRDLLSSRIPPQQVARFRKEDLQALSLCVRGDVTLKTASREMLETAMPGKHALVDAIVRAFQGDDLCAEVLACLLLVYEATLSQETLKLANTPSFVMMFGKLCDVCALCRCTKEHTLLHMVKVWESSTDVSALQWFQARCNWEQCLSGCHVELDPCAKQCCGWQRLHNAANSAGRLCRAPNAVYCKLRHNRGISIDD